MRRSKAARPQRDALQPRAQTPEGQVDVPRLQLRAPVEIQRETAGHVQRFDHARRQIGHAGADQNPRGRDHLRVAAPQFDQRLRPPLVRNQQQREQPHAEEQHQFEQQAEIGEQAGFPHQPPAQHFPARRTLRPRAAFEQIQRKAQRAVAVDAQPGQRGQRPSPRPARLAAQGLAPARCLVEHRPRQHVQRQPVEQRLQPPHQHPAKPRPAERDTEAVAQHEQRQGEGEPGRPHRPRMRAQHRRAEIQRFARYPRAQYHADAFKLHAAPPCRRATTSPAPAATARR